MPVDVGPHGRQLALQAVDHALELGQVPAVAGLGVFKLVLQSRFLREEEEEEASTARSPPLPLRACRCSTHQAHLGLQLDLGRLICSLQIVDLRSGGLKTLRARRHLLAEVVELEASRAETLLLTLRRRVRRTGQPGACLTFAWYQLSMSRRFLSAMVSY